MVKLRGALRNPFSSLFSGRSSSSERVAAYILREHDRGRSLNEILEDPYIRNRCSEAELGRLLDRPEIVRALGEDVVQDARRERT